MKTWTSPGDATAFLSTFEKGKPYYVFSIFTKPTTRQTYELYVGPGFDKDSTSQLWATRADIAQQTVKFTPPDAVAWPSTWVKSYDQATGILTVTMDMNNFDEFRNQFEGARPGKCQPASFCSWKAGANGSPGVCEGASPLPGASADADCKWAGNDIDCPAGGCYGFGVTLTSTFSTDPVVPSQPRPRPKAMCASSLDAAWNVPFRDAPDCIAGICPVAALPPQLFCTDAPN